MMKSIRYFFLIQILLLFTFQGVYAFSGAPPATDTWKAGTARAVITPASSMWLAGYAARTSPSTGKLHDLWAKALVLEDAGGRQAVLISTDLLGVPKALSARIKSRLEEQYGLSVGQIMINSSHTHSGPVLKDALPLIYPIDKDQEQLDKIDRYTQWLEEKIIALVRDAYRSLAPARIYAGNGIVRFQVNRRNNRESALTAQTDLKGPNDYAVPVLKVEDLSGNMKAVVFGYACHGTVLDTTLWSGDYPGFAQIELEKYYPGATAMFLQGAAGDQNPLPRRKIGLAQQYGRELAAAVDGALKENMHMLQPVLVTAYTEIDLPFAEAPTPEEIKKDLASDVGYIRRWAEMMQQKMEKGEPFLSSYPVPLQIWRLGDQKIFALGGEPVIDYAIRLKQLFGEDIFVFGYSNDERGYLPATEMFREKGYEVVTSQQVYGFPSPWKPNIELLILNEFVRLAEEAGIHVEQPE